MSDKPRDLKERTKRFGIAIVKFSRTLPKDDATRVIAKQIVKSGTSVGANYRAGAIARSTADMIGKFKIAEEEADETVYWFEILVGSETIQEEAVRDLRQEATELYRILVASILTLRKRKASE